jgi:hypothetical protein
MRVVAKQANVSLACQAGRHLEAAKLHPFRKGSNSHENGAD